MDDPDADDGVILTRVDPETQRSVIDRSAYAKLHRSTSAKHHRFSVDGVRVQLEKRPNTFTPSAFGYPNNAKLLYPEIKPKKNDEHKINDVKPKDLVRQLESTDSIDQIYKELDDFVPMDGKAKKKGAFRKVLSFFGKDRARDETLKEAISFDNQRNESAFSRTAPERHTMPTPKTRHQRESASIRQIEQRYADMQVNHQANHQTNQANLRQNQVNHHSNQVNHVRQQPQLQDTYGTVFDYKRPLPVVPPEGAKLRLPSNREIYEVQPKLTAPTERISTDKIIATELLKKKPPISPKPVGIGVRPSTSAQVSPSVEYRPMTPVELRQSAALKLSPQKDEVKKQVEEYYWKQLHKLKEEEDRRVMAEISAHEQNVRRSRSVSPSANQAARRSSSIPREGLYGRVRPLPVPEEYSTASRQLFYLNGGQHRPKSAPNRPIFRRGSLSRQDMYDSNAYNKRVSFSNGYAGNILEDEVFEAEQPIYGRSVYRGAQPVEYYQPPLPPHVYYGQQRQPNNGMYASRQSIAEAVYSQGRPVTVHNKYADMYGRIHDDGGSKSGVLMGQLHYPQQFVRGSRLTQSVQNIPLPNGGGQYYSGYERDGGGGGFERKALPAPPSVTSGSSLGRYSDTDSYRSDDKPKNKAKSKKKGFFGKY